MPNRSLRIWSGVFVAVCSGQLVLAGGAKPVRTQEAGNIAALTVAADRISSIQAATSSSGVSTPAPTGQTAGLDNDSCQLPESISGTGVFPFDNTAATLDGLPHDACLAFEEAQIDHDVWFCWTAPIQACGESYSVSTCDQTIDTKIAVYSGCGCPTNDDNLLNCRDDDCGIDGFQTRLSFSAVPGQQYLIRLGTYPGFDGGVGNFLISCDAASPCEEPLSHCQAQDQSDAINSNRTDFVTADGFTPTQSGDINGVCWWGAYLTDADPPQDCEATSTDTFRIRYFTDANGLPGSQIASFSQSAGQLTVEPPFSTGILIRGVAPEYEFHATHANVPVVGGDCYWIEITNELTGCTWFWEVGLSGDNRAVQDGFGGVPLNGYSVSDYIIADLAFCTNLSIAQEGDNCLPPPPPNDDCANASPISGEGTFVVDTATATADGPAHSSCLESNNSDIGQDAWFLWTSSCLGEVVIRTCDTTIVDSKIAVYSGTTCPTVLTSPTACNDDSDFCGAAGFQSSVDFLAAVDQQFLIRVGTFPEALAGVIGFVITCGPPDNAACGAASGNPSCCIGGSAGTGGCGDETCCERVCACDPYCCNTEWDADCASHGLGGSGCGAADLCECTGNPACGIPTSGDCCTVHGPGEPGCNDQTCCETICACDSFCCETEWDQNCAIDNIFTPGCSAAVLCSDLCPQTPPCPSGTIAFVDPPHLSVDARRPHPPGNSDLREGFSVFTVTGPPDAELSCWTVQETAAFGADNTISTAVENPPGTYTVTLSRPITAGAGSSIKYTPTTGAVSQGCFVSHPANVNSNTGAVPSDILELIDNLNLVRVPPLTIWQCDIDRSGLCLPADIITEIDLLNGVNGFALWNGTPRPTGPAGCP